MTATNEQSTDSTWHSHRTASRCGRSPGHVTGADIVRIARTLALEPWHFVATTPAAADDPAGVVLREGRRRVGVEVATASYGCVFSVVLASGDGFCGLGGTAPLACRLFPMDPTDETDTDRPNDEGGALEHPLSQEELVATRKEWTTDRDHWFETVRHWNDLTEDGEEDMEIADFLRYLLEAQACREDDLGWPEEVGI